MTIIFQRLAIVLCFWFLSLFILNPRIDASVLAPQADLYRSKGLAAQANGKYQEALNFYLKAVSAAPESPLLYNDIGIVYEYLGQPDRAQQYYLRILKVDSGYLPAYSNLGYLYLSQGDNEKAEQFFQERLNRSPDNDPWKEKIRAELYRINPQLKARAISEQLAETAHKLEQAAKQKAEQEFVLSVKRAQGHFKRGQDFCSAKKYAQAINEFDKALKITPDNPKLVAAKEQAEYEERIDEIKQRVGTATDQLKTGQVESAKKEFQQILAIIPKEPNSKSKN